MSNVLVLPVSTIKTFPCCIVNSGFHSPSCCFSTPSSPFWLSASPLQCHPGLMHSFPVLSDIYTEWARLYLHTHFYFLRCYLSTSQPLTSYHSLHAHTICRHTNIHKHYYYNVRHFLFLLLHRNCPRVYSVQSFR